MMAHVSMIIFITVAINNAVFRTKPLILPTIAVCLALTAVYANFRIISYVQCSDTRQNRQKFANKTTQNHHKLSFLFY